MNKDLIASMRFLETVLGLIVREKGREGYLYIVYNLRDSRNSETTDLVIEISARK
jgi:hypothetical protein